ncbi:MAG: 1-(5-phosphoribosyl)-5-[(5-phosphoribosylamino)methylideneamino] imidazole-4-carboxamide isomerase, partial [Defluviicoccus sp.]|nr:1-(5-phosphoribosyl)-5-[(5-phosphoribosylamino)methylideneamino] imidazole-4-carboxamide isomerase [Defluviicoccus sp.]
MSEATVFNHDPADQAREFSGTGFEWLHVVDLNGAVEGRPVNADAVAAILGAVDMPVQLGGGIRDRATLDHWMEAGVARAVLGTAALADPDFVREACDSYPGRVALGIDARSGRVATEGWYKTSDVKPLDLALSFEGAGLAAIIYTDIGRDGALGGLNVEATVDLAFALTTPVIASGGVSSTQDLLELKANERAGIDGVICGRALYDGRIDPAEAIAILSG